MNPLQNIKGHGHLLFTNCKLKTIQDVYKSIFLLLFLKD